MKTLGEICLNRSITLRAPKSGEQHDQTAPRLADARSPTTASGQFGRYPATLSPCFTPSSLRKAAREAVSAFSSPQVTLESSSPSAATTSATSSSYLFLKTCSA